MSQTELSQKEWRQSLAQHLFHYYGEMKRDYSDSDARTLVLNEIDELKKAFAGGSSSVSFLSDLEAEEKKWLSRNKAAVQKKDAEEQYYTEEVLNAFKVLKIALKENA